MSAISPNWPGFAPPLRPGIAPPLTAVGKGESNKQIAYFLNVSENPVKVHIHNIMKKLGARNRTEVALKLAGPATTKTPRSTAPALKAHAVL